MPSPVTVFAALLMLLLWPVPGTAHDGHGHFHAPPGPVEGAGAPAARTDMRGPIHPMLRPENLRARVVAAMEEGHPVALADAGAVVDAALEAAPARQPRHRAALLVLRATLRQSVHDFAGAGADLDRALALAPANPQASLSRAYLRTTTGDYPAAAADCAALPRQGAPLARTACAARIASLTGRADVALEALEEALARARGAAPALIAHLHGMRAEILERLGRPGEAGRAHVAAIAAVPHAVSARLDHAAFLLRQGDAERARAIAGGHGATKALMIAARAGRALGRPDPAIEAELEARIAGSPGAPRPDHAHEQAEFALWIAGRPEEALAFAEANWRLQKEPGDLLLLAAAARAAGRPGAAAGALDWARAQGLEDARLPALGPRADAGSTGETDG